jgi:hypothetical protein
VVVVVVQVLHWVSLHVVWTSDRVPVVAVVQVRQVEQVEQTVEDHILVIRATRAQLLQEVQAERFVI